LPSSSRRN